MKFGFLGKKPTVGIDISATSIKMLELAHANGHYQVESVACVPLPIGAVSNNEFKDLAAISDAIKTAKKYSKTTAKYATVAVPSSSVITKIIQIETELTGADLEAQVALEAERFVPYALDEVSLDFEVRGESERTGYQDVLVVVSRLEDVNNRLSVLEEAGFIARQVDVENYAVGRACDILLSSFDNSDHERTVAIIDIGSEMTNLVVLQGNAIIYTRDEHFGGQHLTQVLADQFQISAEQAERLKVDLTLPTVGPTDETAIVQLLSDALFPHIRRQLQFFFAANQNDTLDNVLLSGGTSNIAGLSALISEQLETPVAVANPFANMLLHKRINRAELDSYANKFLVCTGLALRGLET